MSIEEINASPRDVQKIVLKDAWKNGMITDDHYLGMMWDLFDKGHCSVLDIYDMVGNSIKCGFVMPKKHLGIVKNMLDKGIVFQDRIFFLQENGDWHWEEVQFEEEE